VMDPTLRWILSWDGLDVLVMNRDATATSQWGFVRGRQPEIHFAEPTCPDLYCISFEGVFPRDARIDFRTRDGADVLQDAYTDLVVTPSHITLRLTPSGRYAYDTEGLRAWAVNPVMFNWSTDYYLPPIDRSVIGAIHGIAQIGSEYYLHGWACAKTHAESIDIHLYAREPAGDVFLLAATANASSGPEYAAACASTGSHYAFWVHIPSEIRQQHLAQPLLVYGISPFGLTNAALVSSGALLMPGALAIPHRDYIYLGSRVLAVDSQ